jgi:16S rRNA (cytosine967-C5)-methyltransferase
MNAREVAYSILFRYAQESGRLHEQIALALAEGGLSDGEKKYVSNICSGVVRNLNLIDWKLSDLYNGDYKRMLNKIKTLLRLAMYELDYMNFIPPHATVNEFAGLARKKINALAAAQVNGILRNYLREKGRYDPEKKFKYIETQLSVKYSFPEWMIKRWIHFWGEEETRQLCAAFNQRPYFDLRINTLRIKPQDFRQILTGNKIEFSQSTVFPQVVKVYDIIKISKLKLFAEGLCSVQDESGQLVLELLEPAAEGWLVDACAAPGGKLTGILERQLAGYKIIGLDVNMQRLNIVKQNCQRLGLPNYVLVQNDATRPALRSSKFKQILIDAPCSGLGSIQKHPDIKWRRSLPEILEFQELQLRILKAQAELLAGGGLLVYSTCTIEPAENEVVIEKFLEINNGDFEIDPIPDRLTAFSPDHKYLRTFPHRHQMDGSFAVRLRKKMDKMTGY